MRASAVRIAITLPFALAAVACGTSSNDAAASGGSSGDAGMQDGASTSDADAVAPPTKAQAVIAHRGASGHAPEHTFAAYDLGIEMGADYIEQDVAMTSDGVLVCLHDDTLDRTARGDPANCTGPVSAKTLAQLETCDMGSWFNDAHPELANSDFVGLAIPTLDAVFERYGASVAYYIETKTLSSSTPMEEELLRLIREHGLRDFAVSRRQVLVQSFSSESLTRMRDLDPELPLVELLPIPPDDSRLDAVAQYAFGIGPSVRGVTAAVVQSSHDRGLAIHPYTVNESAELESIGRLCVDGMFTNFPDRYRVLIDSGAFDCPPAFR